MTSPRAFAPPPPVIFTVRASIDSSVAVAELTSRDHVMKCTFDCVAVMIPRPLPPRLTVASFPSLRRSLMGFCPSQVLLMVSFLIPLTPDTSSPPVPSKRLAMTG